MCGLFQFAAVVSRVVGGDGVCGGVGGRGWVVAGGVGGGREGAFADFGNIDMTMDEAALYGATFSTEETVEAR